jgi:hypothetical protein
MVARRLSIALFAAAAAAQRAPVKLNPRADAMVQPMAATFTVTATPATITFTATNPATAPSAPGSATAAVKWQNNGTAGNSWNLTVAAGSSTFTGCATVPISAVTVACSSVTVGGSGKGTCSAPFALSTGGQPVATGTENRASATYTVNLTFTLADSWSYIATTGQSCSLTLTYIATLN